MEKEFHQLNSNLEIKISTTSDRMMDVSKNNESVAPSQLSQSNESVDERLIETVRGSQMGSQDGPLSTQNSVELPSSSSTISQADSIFITRAELEQILDQRHRVERGEWSNLLSQHKQLQ